MPITEGTPDATSGAVTIGARNTLRKQKIGAFSRVLGGARRLGNSAKVLAVRPHGTAYLYFLAGFHSADWRSAALRPARFLAAAVSFPLAFRQKSDRKEGSAWYL